MRGVFSDQGRLYGVTPHYALITLILLQVLILRCILGDQGRLYGVTPHYALITLFHKVRGKTPHSTLDYLKSSQSIKHRNLHHINKGRLWRIYTSKLALRRCFKITIYASNFLPNIPITIAVTPNLLVIASRTLGNLPTGM